MKNEARTDIKRLLTRLMLGIGAALLCVACAEFTFPSSEARLDSNGNLILPKGPYQVPGDSGEILVGVQLPETDSEGVEDGVLSYWKTGYEEQAVSIPFEAAWDRLQYVRLEGLDPGADYQMRVSTTRHATVAHPLRRAKADHNKFRFLVIGDTKPYPSHSAAQLVELMDQIPAAFYVHLGDFAREGDHVGDWSNFLEFHRPLLSKMPIVPVVGNHDRSKWLVFSNIFLLPQRSAETRRYYRFEHGNTMVIVLDPFVDYFYGSRQYDFLEQSLESSRNEEIDHVFLASHKPFYSSGSHGGTEDMRRELLPMIEKYSVTAVLAAHDHSYQRTKPINGIVHFIIGGGGAELKGANYADYTAVTVKANHFAEIIIDGPSAFVRAFDVDGSIIDEARIR